MQHVSFQIMRTSDKEIVEAINRFVEDKATNSEKIHFQFLSDASIEIAANELTGHKQLNALVTADSRLFGRITLHCGGLPVVIVRHAQSGTGNDNDKPFDSVNIDPRKADFVQVAQLIGKAQAYFGKFSITGLRSYLGDEAKSHFEARDIALARLETLVVRLTERLEEQRRNLVSEHETKAQQLEQSFQKRQATLEQEVASKKKQFDDKLSSLDDRESKLNLRAAETERRQIRSQMKTAFTAASQSYEITTKTKNLRWIIHVLSIGLLGTFAALAWHNFSKSLADLETWERIVIHIRQATATALFVSTGIFYARWNTQWFQRRSNEEFRLKRLEIDFDLASWVTELLFQWKKEYPDQPIPNDLIQSITDRLFSTTENEPPTAHPYDNLTSALLGATARLRLSPTGTEIELDRSGLKKLRSETESRSH